MDYFPIELIDLVLYFTEAKISTLIKINKYFRRHVTMIRLGISVEYFEKLYEFTELDLRDNQAIMYDGDTNKIFRAINFDDKILSQLNNLRSLKLTSNSKITDISNVTGLVSLDLSHNQNITDISTLTNLVYLNLSHNNKIADISTLTNLTELNIKNNNIIDRDKLINSHNLTSIITEVVI